MPRPSDIYSSTIILPDKSLLKLKLPVLSFIVRRYQKERRAAMRNAKIRLSNLKVSELAQVMRNKSKRIKH